MSGLVLDALKMAVVSFSDTLGDLREAMNFPIDSTSYKSPNFNERSKPVSMIVVHTTASKTLKSAADWLCLESSDVSTHYIISQIGRIYQLVDDSKRAWHAGKCSWPGVVGGDVNDVSLGIELENRNDGKEPYPQIQIDALTYLVEWKVRQYGIKDENIVRHLDVAIPPGRKTDPAGFDWIGWKKHLVGHKDDLRDAWDKWGTVFPLYSDEKSFGIPQFWLKHTKLFGEARSNEVWIVDDAGNGIWAYRAFELGLIFYLKKTGMVAGVLNSGLAVD